MYRWGCSVQTELLEWRTEFEAAHDGRAPSRAEMMADPIAARLFGAFQQCTKLEWPAEMKGMITEEMERHFSSPPPPKSS